jgi:hypothetical protein
MERVAASENWAVRPEKERRTQERGRTVNIFFYVILEKTKEYCCFTN